MKEKEKDLEKAEERGHALIQKGKGPACSVVVETLKGLKQSWACLDQTVNIFTPLLFPCSYCSNITAVLKTLIDVCQINQRKGTLRMLLEQWTLYRRASEEINGYLIEGRYSVSRLRLLNSSLGAVQQQVEGLEVRNAEC